jgi:hypothetical protein
VTAEQRPLVLLFDVTSGNRVVLCVVIPTEVDSVSGGVLTRKDTCH